jgi:type IV pilus assembly protein PilW
MQGSASRSSWPRAAGFGLVEIMVGLLIGLIAILVIYQVYTVAEGFKRNTTAVGEAQQTGLFSIFMLGMEAGNAAAGMSDAATDLGACADPGSFAASFRPIPVLITDGGGNSNPDSFAVNYSMSSTLTTSATFAADAAPNTDYVVQSPGGFHNGDMIVAVAQPSVPNTACESSVIAAPVPTPDFNGFVTLTHSGTAANMFASASRLINMGPCSKAQKVQYSLNNGILYQAPLLDGNCKPIANPVGNPLASNIVNMKVEYGVANIGDPLAVVSKWVQADAGNGWDPATVLPAPINQVNLIKAIRIGFIVRSEQFDQTLGNYDWVLFDCSDPNKANCTGRLTGTIAASVAPPGNWRYRTYETIIPLRNVIWNKT